MRITVHVEGKRYDVELEQLPFEDTIDHVVLNGKPVRVTVSPDWAGHFSKCLIVGDRSYQIEFELDHDGLPCRVWAVGQAVDVSLDFPGKGKLKRPEMTGLWGEGDQVRAPLPGKVISIRVVPGQRVHAGDLLCLLEAMKMENELLSPRAGTIKDVLIQEGENVQRDQVLITLG
jgi:biotin carboxyl carrier protein